MTDRAALIRGGSPRSSALTPKRRMLNAYRGLPVDRPPVAPEFWYLFPARVLGVDLVELEREIPHWKALHITFRKYGTEGWGIAFPELRNPDRAERSELIRIGAEELRDVKRTSWRGKEFVSTTIFSPTHPSSVERPPVGDPADLPGWIDMELSERNAWDFTQPRDALRQVGEDYLLELWLGVPFFDFIAAAVGFEPAVVLFCSGSERLLEAWRQRYTERQRELVRQACASTGFESIAIGCSSSCISLIGPGLWRQWDKPYIAAMAEEIHRQGRLLHVHFHGRSMESAADFAAMGVDCVCPWERPPGGDVAGRAGLRTLRELLDERVTMNGNVHTVETLIRGTPDRVRAEVAEIREAFAGSHRFIIGTGDQVGGETPEENIAAMVEAARAP